MRNNTFLYTRLSTSFVNGLCVMLDNKDSLLMLSFALQDVLRYILNGGTQLLSFQANVEGNFQPSYRIRSLLLLSLICDVSSFSSYRDPETTGNINRPFSSDIMFSKRHFSFKSLAQLPSPDVHQMFTTNPQQEAVTSRKKLKT